MSEKLQKVLARQGLASRREAERWIDAGRVTVNGKPATRGDRVMPEDRIKVDGRGVSQKRVAHRYLLYNKPEGEICTRNDPEQRPTVFDHLPPLKNQRWISVGRLDFNTSGLLLFTTDGDLAGKLMHPSSDIEREYLVRVLGNVTEDALRRMCAGVSLEDGVYQFSDIQPGRQSDADRKSANQWYYVALMEGRNRMVRRLWESQGYTLSRLKRVRFGNFVIPSAAKAGRYVDLKPKEVKALYAMTDLPPRRVRA